MHFKNNDMTKLNPYKQNFIWFNLKTTKFSPIEYILGVSTVINIYMVVHCIKTKLIYLATQHEQV